MSAEGHNSADVRLRSFIDRVLRLKEEQDTLGDDIKEIYAEAKTEGYDKTAMGALVTEIRKQQKDRAGFTESQEILDLYRQAYARAHTHTHTHAHTHAPARTREAVDLPERASARPVDGLPATAQMGPQAVTAGETATDFSPPTFLTREAKPFRPHCQHPENCGGYGSRHCASCLKASGQSEAA